MGHQLLVTELDQSPTLVLFRKDEQRVLAISTEGSRPRVLEAIEAAQQPFAKAAVNVAFEERRVHAAPDGKVPR